MKDHALLEVSEKLPLGTHIKGNPTQYERNRWFTSMVLQFLDKEVLQSYHVLAYS